jgi:CO/xanthine dehydrogenase Mo-binding subunit
MRDFPAREKLDITEKVARYLVVAGTLDKNSPAEDYDIANELSLELAMLLPASIYRAMVEAAMHPDGKVNPGVVAVMMRKELMAVSSEPDLHPEQVAFHTLGAPAPKPRSKAH